MSDISKVLIIGSNEYAQKIEALFSKAGFQTFRTEEGVPPAFPPDLIIEAVPGDTPAKGRALKGAGQHSPAAILATTAPGGITLVAAATGRPALTVGLNFMFNPFESKTLVQIGRGLETGTETVETCRKAAEKAGAVAIVVEDVTGLIVDRVMASVINEAAYMLETKLASQEDINVIPKLCLNWPAGPFEFADMIGLDNVVATLEAASRDSTQYLPCRLLREMVAAGRLGKKSGRGFYDYTKKV